MRFVGPPDLPEGLDIGVASRLRRMVTAAGIDVACTAACGQITPIQTAFSGALNRA